MSERIYSMVRSEREGRETIQECFATVLAKTRRDVEITCVDMSPVAGWLDRATTPEVDSLFKATPIALPIPAALVGMVHSDPDSPERFRVMLAELARGHTLPDGRVLISFREYTPTPLGFVADDNGRGAWIVTRPDGTLIGINKMSTHSLPDAFSTEAMIAGLAMFHVRNIGMEPRQLPRHVRRRMAKDGVEGPQVYHTLTLRPYRAAGEEKGTERQQTGTRPLHLVRGHFARYTKARPLFGRYEGTFWRPEHEAGNPAVAVVRKTFKYELAREAGATA